MVKWSKLSFPSTTMVLRKISSFEGNVLPILYFRGEQGHMRHNASLYSGFIGNYCGTQKHLQYGPNGDSSKRHTIGELVVCL